MRVQKDRQERKGNLNSVDDLMVTSESQDDLDTFGLYLMLVHPETRTASGTTPRVHQAHTHERHSAQSRSYNDNKGVHRYCIRGLFDAKYKRDI